MFKMKIIKKREDHLNIPTEKIKCDHCGSVMEITENDIIKDTRQVFIFPIRVEYVECPVCGVEIYRIPRNFWTRDLGFGYDYDL